jgi:16S rRNA (cytosine967-C5)-methyltransferase
VNRQRTRQPAGRGNVRAEAALLLERVLPAEEGGHSLSAILPAWRERSADAPLLQELVYGVCRYYSALDYLVARRMRTPLKARERELHLLLLVGAFQLLHTRIPDHAAIAETVAAARALDKDWATGLVNALLRRLQRERDGLLAELEAAPLATCTAHPAWLVEMIEHDWPQQARQILEANNARPPFCLRINTARTSREAWLARAAAAGIPADATALSPVGVRLPAGCDVHLLPGFDEGEVSVQDEAAQLCAPLFPALAAGARVLDACAAPGGKTAHLAERFPGIDILALEIDAARAHRIHETLDRLHLAARVQVADAAAGDWWDGVPFDAILLDAPCSATGVIRRHPDSKWLRRKGDIARLATAQRALLAALWPKLRPGGTLVYATCSVLRDENERVMVDFLACHPDATEIPLPDDLGLSCSAGRQLLPANDGPDGFFLCRLQKAAGTLSA